MSTSSTDCFTLTVSKSSNGITLTPPAGSSITVTHDGDNPSAIDIDLGVALGSPVQLNFVPDNSTVKAVEFGQFSGSMNGQFTSIAAAEGSFAIGDSNVQAGVQSFSFKVDGEAAPDPTIHNDGTQPIEPS